MIVSVKSCTRIMAIRLAYNRIIIPPFYKPVSLWQATGNGKFNMQSEL